MEMMMNNADNLKFFYDRLSELYRLGCIGSLMGWDQQTYMPVKAAEARASQNEYIASAMHQKATDPRFLDAVDELAASMDQLSSDDQVNVREMKRELDKERKLPPEFVAELAEVTSLGFDVWAQARPKNDFEAVKPYLEKIFELNRRRCDLVGYEEHPYDALLDIYEPGSKTSTIKPLLVDLGEQLSEIIPSITEKFGGQTGAKGHYEQKSQYELVRKISGSLGFDFESGRLDTALHPFMTSLGPNDFRITTRYDESNYMGCLYSVIHETGHALYELGLPKEWAGTPMGSAVSLGIHESQSRLWENQVGRSREFCSYLSGVIGEFFPQASTDPEALWKDVNRVAPSLIRTEADEVTYSQHVVIRMLLEEEIITGNLSITDLPGAWNDLYEKYLGLRPSDYKNGVMQDMHWYTGAVGYFPTYALGNLYNAMMMVTAKVALPDLSDQIKRGEFAPLLAWLRENVHRYGMRYKGPELVKIITGQDLSAGPFVAYLKNKFLS
jgi:carboxypeptidase Taq